MNFKQYYLKENTPVRVYNARVGYPYHPQQAATFITAELTIHQKIRIKPHINLFKKMPKLKFIKYRRIFPNVNIVAIADFEKHNGEWLLKSIKPIKYGFTSYDFDIDWDFVNDSRNYVGRHEKLELEIMYKKGENVRFDSQQTLKPNGIKLIQSIIQKKIKIKIQEEIEKHKEEIIQKILALNKKHRKDLQRRDHRIVV